jgi:hypothetical protein
MSTLTHTSTPFAPAVEHAPERKSFWRRAYQGIINAQQRRAEREIRAFLWGRGDFLTDETEREMMQRLTGGPRRSI